MWPKIKNTYMSAGRLISCHKTPLRDGFHSKATTHEYEAGLDKKINSRMPYTY